MSAVLGAIGAALLPIAWLLQSYRTYDVAGIDAVNARFLVLYVVASLLLTYHAFRIRDAVFIALFTAMTMFAMTELVLLARVKQAQ